MPKKTVRPALKPEADERSGTSPLLLRAGLRYQLRHRWQLLLALVGIAMGVTVVLAVDLANGAAKASFALSSQQLSGAATHRIVGATGEVPDELYLRLFTTPGHPPMAPVINARVRTDRVPGRLQLLGIDLFADGSFRDPIADVGDTETSLGQWLSLPGATALSRSAADRLGLALDEVFEVRYQGGSHELRVVAIGGDDSLTTRDLLIVDVATAKAITGQSDSLSHIDLRIENGGLAWVEQHLEPGFRVIDVNKQLRETAGLSAAFELNLTAMSLLAMLVGMFLIFNAISFSMVQRRNLLGRLRALGVTAAELRRLILREALVLAIAGTAIGTILGFWLGQGLTQIVASTISQLYYSVAADAMSWNTGAVLKAWLLGIAGTLIAAWLPARQAGRTPPLTTLSRAALEKTVRRGLPRLALAGSVLCAIGLLVALRLPGGVVVGFAGLFVVLIGAAMITPFVLRLAHWLLVRLPFRGVARMAVRDIERHLSRLGTAAAALMVALAASVGVAVMVESMRGAVSDWLDALLTADLYVAAEGFEDGAPLPAAVSDGARRLTAVDALSSYRNRNVTIDGQRVRLVAAELAPRSRGGFDFVARGSDDPWSGFDNGEVLASEPLAYRLGLTPGDALPIETPRGVTEFVITAVFRDFASEHGRLFIDRDHYRTTWRDELIDTLALFAGPAGRDALLTTVRVELGDRFDLAFTATRDIYEESMRVFDRTFRITDVLRWLSILVAFVGVFSALMALQLERRKEYAILRALGLTRWQVSQLITIESLILGLIAALLAVPVGLAMAWILTAAIQLRAFGWTMPLTITAAPLLWSLVIGACAALLASILPAARSARQDPAPQLRED